MSSAKSTNEPIAVIGSACRFAGGSSSPSKLWDLLKEPRDVLKDIPDSRFSAEGFYHPDGSYHGRSNVKASYLIEEDVRTFDAQFFGIKPVEAGAIDPQQRLLLETVYEALESAGQSIQSLRGSDTGVYAGQMCSDFEFLAYRDLDELPTYHATGTGRSIMANRVSYFFDWHGPSMTLDTACSSSLYAVYLAAQALRSGESRAAVACGTNLLLGPEYFVSESKLNMLSPDSRSRMWDDAANGYARGDGVAAVVVKTLSAALEDGDDIDCIIREVCVNQDGATSGITMPSAKAQAALIRQTYTKAGLDYLGDGRPQYVEAHGTGTPAGDPIEAEALSTAFFPDGTPQAQSQQPIYVGSIKTVLGHTEGTAGVAALIKVSLALQHGLIPPNMHFNQLNPKIEPFYHSLQIPTSLGEWPVLPAGQARRASINSFGFGGANAHAVIENYIPELHSSNLISRKTLLSPQRPAALPFGVYGHGGLLIDTKSEGGFDDEHQPEQLPMGPYVFSAASEQSLVANLEAYSAYLAGPSATALNPRDLAWTLRQRRSNLPFKVAFPAGSIEQLRSSIDARLEEAKSNKTALGRRSLLPQNSKPRVLAVFTGQGAQYARMGAELLNRSPMARQTITQLEGHLAALPESQRPRWSLEQELRAPPATSRLNEATLSQPLCTALQIVQVDLLRVAGVEFTGAVGHSSGEIGAAYAAGLLSARDALLVAYFRGLTASSAASPSGAHVKGAMMAVGTSMEDAAEIVAEFEGAATVAACNSSASVTLSGDQDAIDELAIIFEDEGKFNRKLKVDKAYHSSHMLPCSAPYIQALGGSGIKVRAPAPGNSKGRPVWYSTVYPDLDMSSPEALGKLQDGSYWSDNMVQPVLFYQGLNKALAATGTFDLAIEIGPHPALKGPATQTIQEALNRDIPYHGVLARGTAADVALSAALGFLWSQESTSQSLVNLESFEIAAGAAKSDGYRVLKGLPSYQWNHERAYWRESRRSRRLRTRKVRVNPILGAVEPEISTTQQRWRNILREREIPWLSGHQLQGRTVFPAAGYVSTLIEAVRQLPQIADAGGDSSNTIRLIDISNFRILQAISFGEDDSGVEILVTLENILKDDERQSLRAHFTYSSASGSGRDPDAFALSASADVEVLLGEPDESLLPARQADPPNLVDVADDRFYGTLADRGYGYTGPFRALSSLRRKLGKAVAQVSIPPRRPLDESGSESSYENTLLVHPGTLDGAIQAVLLAFCHPGDGQLWSLHVPTVMERIRVNPALCGSGWGEAESVHVAAMSEASADGDKTGMAGDVDIFAAPRGNWAAEHAAIQVEGVRTVPFAGATAADDDRIFGRMRWANGSPDGDDMLALDAETTPFERNLVVGAERAALFYLREFERDLAPDHPVRSHPTYSHYLAFARHMNGLQNQGRHKHARKEWASDTLEDVLAATEPFKDCIDIRIIHKVGEIMSPIFDNTAPVVPEQTVPLPIELLAEYYADAVGSNQCAQWLGRAVKQLVHRYPNMNILEVGAGTGAATKPILAHIGAQGFSSYTYTDISAYFFEEATSIFAPYAKRMIFKTLDAARDPISQGYTPGSYDLIVAASVLHATPRLGQTLRNLRRLLRPGGFLIVNESTNSTFARDGFIFGTMPGWWTGMDEGRTLSPLVGPEHWDELLRESGFSGVDTITPLEAVQETHSNAVFVSQAVDDTVSFLREPLSSPFPGGGGGDGASLQDLVIIGGATLRTGRVVSEIKRALAPHVSGSVITFKRLLDLPADWHSNLSPDACVLSLSELDSPVFEDLTAASFDALKRLVAVEHTLLWVTRGKLSGDSAASGMSAGFLRAVVHEVPGLRVQCVDLDPELHPGGGANGRADAALLAEALLRFRHLARIQTQVQTTQAQEPPLWSVEPEIAVDARGHQLVPRFLPDIDANDRFNSARRTITRELDVRELTLPNTTELRATTAIISPVDTPLGPLFLTLGLEEEEEAGDSRFLALAESLTSRVRVPRSATALIANSKGRVTTSPSSPGIRETEDAKLLVQVAAHLLAESALQGLVPGQSITFHNASSGLARVLGRRAAERSLNAIFTTSRGAETTGGDHAAATTISIPAFLPAREIRSRLPKDLARFVIASAQDSHPAETERIAAVLPVNCRVDRLTTAAFQGQPGRDLSGMSPSPYRSATESAHGMLGDTLQRALKHAQEDLKMPPPIDVDVDFTVHTVSASDLTAATSVLQDPLAVLDWQAAPIVQARISRLDTKPIFKSDRTYWLVGLSRGLGLSICDWMIAKGAKYVVISSRSPDVEAGWEESCRKKGAVVKIFANDITDGNSVETLYKTICDTLPPLAGVMMGAMVLRDRLVRDMTFEDMQIVLGPKVDGSRHLDRLLGDRPLDFFIYFSSMMQVLGNLGQANYVTANAAFPALAAQRRKRGLAASIVDIGAVSGAGAFGVFSSESADNGENSLLLVGLRRVSEIDVYQLLAEAINSGYGHLPLGPGEEPAIGLGMRFVSPGEPSLPRWFGNPKFAGFVLRDEDEDSAHHGSANGKNAASVQERLLQAQNTTQVHEAIRDSFLAKVRPMLQIEGADDDALMRMRSNEIGMDSLIAVDIRSWFLKQLSVSIPVLKILNGVSIGELVDEAVAKISPELVPSLNSDSALPPRPTSAGSSVPSSSSSSSSVPNSPASPATEATSRMSHETVGEADQDLVSLPKGKQSEIPAVMTKPLTLERSISLSHTQSMFWVVHSLLEDKTTLNHTGFTRMTGRVRVQDLKAAVQQLSNRHESMRACFYLEDHVVKQGILKTGRVELEHREIGSYEEVEQEFDQLKKHVYDLARGKFMRIILLTRTDSPTDNYLMIGAHHVNFDGMCTQIILRDLEAFYSRRANLALSSAVNQYSAFIDKQREDEITGAWDGDLAFWRREFATIPEPLPLSRARVSARKPLLRYDVHLVEFRLDPALAERVRAAARQHRGGTAFHFYLAAFRILLQRFLSLGASSHGGQQNQPASNNGGDDDDDICIGIADANRHDEETLGSVGPYMNLLALRFQDRPATFASALASARDKAFAALSHAAPPFDTVLQALRVPRDVSHAPLFQAFLDYRLGFPGQQPFADCTLEAPRFELGRTAYDLSVDIIDTNNNSSDASSATGDGGGGNDVLVSVYGQAALYEQEDVRVFAACFEDLIREFAHEPSRSLVGTGSEWSYRDADVTKALELGRGPAFETRWPGTLAHRLDDVVAANGDKLAVRLAVTTTGSEGGDYLTYKQLDDKTNAIAAALMENGVSRGQYVAVYQELTPDWICSILGILKIGAVYVPLDPGTPVARLAMVVATCHPAALLVDKTTQSGSTALALALDTYPTTVIEVSTVLEPAFKPNNLQRRIQTVPDARDPAIALHTSGTTGTPKVIVLTHANLANEVESSTKTYGLDSNVTVLQQSASGFDMSVLQIMLALALGGTLVVVPRGFRGDAVAVTEFIAEHKVTYTCATPTEYRSWFRHGDCAALRRSHWSVALSGGEAVDHSLLGAFREHFGVGAESSPENMRPFRLFNGYGPAETTCCSASIELTSMLTSSATTPATIPAGPACANESVYILDEEMRPLPLGLPGEICIGGVAVARGYLELGEQPVLTARAFVRNPFATQEYIRKGWTTMFRTRDRGRLLPDGSLVVEGRIGDDTQIKIRGAVAVARTTTTSCSSAAEQDSKFVVGYVVLDAEFLSHDVQPLEEGPTAATSRVQGYLARLLSDLPLPRTVRPSMLIPIDKVPRTTSGKTDRRALAVLSLDQSSASSNTTHQEQPLTDMELRVQAIWEQVLNSQPHPGEHVNHHNTYETPLVTAQDTDFFHVGGTSMLLLDLRQQIKRQLGLSVPLMQLFEHSTLGAMATFLTAQEANQQANIVAASPQPRIDIDWEAEATPSDELRQLAGQFQTPLPRSSSIIDEAEAETNHTAPTVILTGASGILGRQVLHRLLASQRTGTIGKIICVALRQIKSRVASNALPAPTTHLIYLPGDLRQKRLGLTPAEWASVAAQADTIVHVGAEVSHTKTYATLRAANVDATAELARLCLEAGVLSRRPVPFHFVSTGEIPMLGSSNGTEESETLILYEESVRSAQVVPDQGDAVARGYAATKWVGERMLENLADISGGIASTKAGSFRVWIHRPSAITTPQDETAVGPDAPILPRILFYSRLLRAVPGDGTSGGFGIRGSMDFVPLEKVAEDIVNVVVEAASSTQAVGDIDDDDVKEADTTDNTRAVTRGVQSGGVTYVHHTGGTVMELATLRKVLEAEEEKATGQSERYLADGEETRARRFEVLPFKEWTDKAEAAGLHPLLAGLFRGVEQQKRAVVFPRFVKGPR
ncbi:uncharacterized protein PODANS_0_240 [Podospora anserina S mat+]|uniref:Podospora anserina S mat+ genomic DNA chromosome 6, supercontig 3 n=1 Tax=Podospora anserina (strain S / ATCC MYA-4624 / DSM 980 / FGSC 10383) TaxID=515849 RepID=B2AFV9_PODAN|nr:uncharacterized protein PODANS_0_240 [Podospora anserina S mat+]CAP62330.1 unnamed protein product [Podospora anserina S mat+]